MPKNTISGSKKKLSRTKRSPKPAKTIGILHSGTKGKHDKEIANLKKYLKLAGYSVPKDVSVIGYDDMLLSRLSTPSLSTIKQDTKKAGRLLVMRALEGAQHGPSERLPTDLIIRESCGG